MSAQENDLGRLAEVEADPFKALHCVIMNAIFEVQGQLYLLDLSRFVCRIRPWRWMLPMDKDN